MISESGGRAVVITPSALGSKDHPVGPSKIPLRESARQYIRRGGSVVGMWRRRLRGEFPDMTISRVLAQQGKVSKNGIPGRKQQNDRSVAPARVAFNLGLAFDNNRVVEGLGFSSDGSAGRLVGLQAEARLLRGGQVLCGQPVALRVGLRE